MKIKNDDQMIREDDQMTARFDAHVRTHQRRNKRTARNMAVIRDREPTTLCGAEVTVRDVSYATIVRSGKLTRRARTAHADFPLCPACMAKARDITGAPTGGDEALTACERAISVFLAACSADEIRDSFQELEHARDMAHDALAAIKVAR